MLKHFLQTLIRKHKNSNFAFDSAVTNGDLYELALDKSKCLLRGIIYMLLQFKCPLIIFMGKGVRFSCARKINLGAWITLDDSVYLCGLGRNGLSIGVCTKIGAFSRLVVSSSFNNLGEHISVGSNVAIGEFSRIGGSGGVIIGNNTIIGQYFSAHPENHIITDTSKLIKDQGTVRMPITVGSNCWIGSKVTLLAGTTIGDNCVIGAGSVVTKDIPTNSIAVGCPAKVIKVRSLAIKGIQEQIKI
jgi:acetyltransferase-like isoleucine patch superfamily enzyme